MSGDHAVEETAQPTTESTSVRTSAPARQSTGTALALQHALGNRATTQVIQRHPGPHPALDGHTAADHDAEGHGPGFVPLEAYGDDPAAFVNGIGGVLDLVRSLRPDAEFRAAGLSESIFRPTAAYVYFEDYVVATDTRGRIRHVIEQPSHPTMIDSQVVLLREPGTTRLWIIGTVGDRARARLYRNVGGMPVEGIPEGITVLLSFLPGLLLGEERARSMERRARGRSGTAAEAAAWAREAASGAARRRRRRRRDREARSGGPGGTDEGTGTGVRGEGRGGGGDAATGHGTSTTGTGTGSDAASEATGRGQAVADANKPLRGPEDITLEVSPNGTPRLRITIDSATTRVNLRNGESDRSLDRRVDRAIDDLQRSRDPNAQGNGVDDGAEQTGFTPGGSDELGGEVAEGEERGPGAAGGTEAGTGTTPDDGMERLAGGDSIANASAYPSHITMAGYQRPERRSGDPVPLSIAHDTNAPTTVLGATNAFTMTLDYAARSLGMADEVFNRLQSINFYWELIDVSNMTEAAAQSQSRATAVGGGAAQGVGSGVENNLERDMQDIADDQRRDIEMMREENWSWEARAAYLGVIGLSNVVRTVGSLISAYVSIVTTPMNERSIGFDTEGEYLVRCVATPVYSDEALADPDNSVIRASSIAVLPIRVQNLDERADEAMSAEDRAIARLREQAEHGDTEEERETARLRLAAAERDVHLTGLGAFRQTVNGLHDQLRLAESLKQHQDHHVPEGSWPVAEIELALHLATRRQTVDALIQQVRRQLVAYAGEDADLTHQGDHERWVTERAGEFAGREYRPRIVLASRVNGQVTPVLAMLGKLPSRSETDPPTWRLVDITSPGSRDYYEGTGTGEGDAADAEAIRRAFREFAEGNGYGRGLIAIRIPQVMVDRYPALGSFPTRMESAPGPTERALQRLQDLATVAEIAGLFVTGPVGLALGAVGAVAGLVSSIDSLARRSRTGKLLEVGIVFDIFGVVGAVAGIGGLGTAIGRLHLERIIDAGGSLPSWVTRLERTERRLRIHGVIDNVQQMISVPYQLWEQLDAAAQIEPEGERRKAVALAMLQAIRSGSMTIIQTSGGFADEPRRRRVPDDTTGDAAAGPPGRLLVDESAADAHADGSGPALPPRDDTPAGDDATSLTPSPDDDTAPSDGPVSLLPPTEAAMIAEAEARARRRVAAADTLMGRPANDNGIAPDADAHTGAPTTGGDGTRADASTRTAPPPPGSEHIAPDIARLAAEPGGGDPAAARRILETAGDIGTVRRQLELLVDLPDDQRTAAATRLQEARAAIIDEHVTAVLTDLQARFPDLDIQVVDLGTPGLASDRDITIRAEPRDPAAYSELGEAERAAIDRDRVRASLEAIPLLYESFERAGLPPDRALDTNFYTELHEGSFTARDDAIGIAADQQIVSLTEVLMNTSGDQWQSYVDRQVAMIDGMHDTPADMRQALRGRFLDEVAAAEVSARRMLGGDLPSEVPEADRSARRDQALTAARDRLVEALSADPPTSPRDLRRLMADIKLLEPDAYGTRAAVEGVVLGAQSMRRASRADVLRDGFRTQADIDAGVGAPGPRRFDPESGAMVEVSAEQEVVRRRREAGRHVGHGPGARRDATAYEINAPRMAAAQAVLGHLLAHLPTGGADHTHAAGAAKNLGRIRDLASDVGVRRTRAGGLAHLHEITAAKQAADAPAAMAAALRRWAGEGDVRGWASSNGMRLDTDVQRLAAFLAWSQRKANGLVGEMRRRTSTAAYAGDVELGSAHTARSPDTETPIPTHAPTDTTAATPTDGPAPDMTAPDDRSVPDDVAGRRRDEPGVDQSDVERPAADEPAAGEHDDDETTRDRHGEHVEAAGPLEADALSTTFGDRVAATRRRLRNWEAAVRDDPTLESNPDMRAAILRTIESLRTELEQIESDSARGAHDPGALAELQAMITRSRRVLRTGIRGRDTSDRVDYEVHIDLTDGPLREEVLGYFDEESRAFLAVPGGEYLRDRMLAALADRDSLVLRQSPRTAGERVEGTDGMRRRVRDQMQAGAYPAWYQILFEANVDRDGWARSADGRAWEIDHVVELWAGGEDLPANYLPLHPDLHDIKSEIWTRFRDQYRERARLDDEQVDLRDAPD